MTDLSKTDSDALQAKAAEAAKAFAESAPPTTYTDPDPSSTVDPHPELAFVQGIVEKAAPGVFGGVYKDEHGVVHVGLTGVAGLDVGVLRKALPGVDLAVFSAPHSWQVLTATTDEIADLMSAQSTPVILSAGPKVKQNVVTVGLTDVESPVAQALIAKYGNIVSVFKDDPLELRTDAVAHGRDRAQRQNFHPRRAEATERCI